MDIQIPKKLLFITALILLLKNNNKYNLQYDWLIIDISRYDNIYLKPSEYPDICSLN